MVWSLKFLQKTICSLSINNIMAQSKYIKGTTGGPQRVDLNLHNGIEKK